MEAGGDDARAFLRDFLDQLQALNQTNVRMLQQNAVLAQQNAQLTQAVLQTCGQLQAAQQQIAVLTQRIEVLSQILLEEDAAEDPVAQAAQAGMFDALGQLVAPYVVPGQVAQGRGGGGKRRRR